LAGSSATVLKFPGAPLSGTQLEAIRGFGVEGTTAQLAAVKTSPGVVLWDEVKPKGSGSTPAGHHGVPEMVSTVNGQSW
jgi:hypothetical protein